MLRVTKNEPEDHQSNDQPRGWRKFRVRVAGEATVLVLRLAAAVVTLYAAVKGAGLFWY